ncbi:hypothetical protein RRG08_015709 [Elysia crispata]|uniref:C1q domain-containing protein n=1 Tax=Elysia crispata TaxID=231223 RepID=A0AAE1EEV5_9GAST|nr:hypothetical protein RRG08_015709 [Elysia crispata]
MNSSSEIQHLTLSDKILDLHLKSDTLKQSKMSAVDASKNSEMVSNSVENLKCLGKEVAEVLSSQVDELSAACQKALQASNNDKHVADMVTFRLKSFSDILENVMLMIQGAETLPTRTKPDEQLFSSLVERINKLEESNVTLEKICVDNQAACTQTTSAEELKTEIELLQSKIGMLTISTSQIEESMAQVQQGISPIPELEAKLQTVTTEMEACCKESKIQKNKIKNLQMLVEDSTNLRSQLKKMKSKHQALKQQIITIKDEKDTASLLLAKRLSNLERLREILKRDQPRGATAPETNLMSENLHTQLRKLETDILQLSRSPVGFTVQLQEDRVIDQNCQVKKLFDIVTNFGECFKPYQGHFVVPYDGLYCFCVKLEQEGDDNFTAGLMSKEINEEADQDCPVSTHSFYFVKTLVEALKESKVRPEKELKSIKNLTVNNIVTNMVGFIDTPGQYIAFSYLRVLYYFGLDKNCYVLYIDLEMCLVSRLEFESSSRGARVSGTGYGQGQGWLMYCAGAGVIFEGCQGVRDRVRSGSRLVDVLRWSWSSLR